MCEFTCKQSPYLGVMASPPLLTFDCQVLRCPWWLYIDFKVIQFFWIPNVVKLHVAVLTVHQHFFYSDTVWCVLSAVTPRCGQPTESYFRPHQPPFCVGTVHFVVIYIVPWSILVLVHYSSLWFCLSKKACDIGWTSSYIIWFRAMLAIGS